MAPFFTSLLGGVLIGTACTIYLMGIGRIAGISGMAAKFLNRQLIARLLSFFWV
ncbi:hypothetical protein [Asaia prunellae]|uniref:hypothetical protein n=1 Tax=Asaia prunellae TaxID=610245 RepID=UPI000ACFEC66|nr:hypothetical protein [Asaia prunellae]